MIRKAFSLFLIITFLTQGFSLKVLASFAEVADSSLLSIVKTELEAAETPYALIMNEETKEVVSIPFKAINKAFKRDEAIWLTYFYNNRTQSGLYLEPDLIKHVHSTAVTPKAREALSEGKDIGLDLLRSLVETKTNVVVVAVLDTGIDVTHPWFHGRIFSPYDVVEEDYEPQDMTGHGTHVAGIIASNTPSNVRIMPIRVFGEDGGASDSNIVKGIYYAVKNGADLINLSLGGYGTTSYLEKAIDYAYSKGVMVVASAGNDAHDLTHDYPAAFPEVITVGATGRDGDILYFSNTGHTLDVCAPGEKILSAVPGSGTDTKSGTSMAAPFVSSAVAMLLLEDPSRTFDAIESILKENTRDLGRPGIDPVFGSGELAFTHYKSNPDFYVIGSSKEASSQEEKFDYNLKYYAGDNVRKLDIRIDGNLHQTILISKPGVWEANLNIRNLMVGSHTLEIQPFLRDGTQLKPYTRNFIVPEYNLRIRVYDILDQPVVNPTIEVLGFSEQDRVVERINTQSVTNNGVWMANLDFGRLSRFDKLVCDVLYEQGDSSNKPLYFRIAAKTGEKVFETSESNVLSVSSNYGGIMPECHVATRIIGEKLIGFETEMTWRRNPNVYSVLAGNARIQMIANEVAGQTSYSGLLFYDTSDLWIELFSYPKNAVQPDTYPEAWYYFGFMKDIAQDVDYKLSDKPSLKLETDAGIPKPYIFSVRDVENDKQIFSKNATDSDSLLLTPGYYAFQAEPRRILPDGRTAWDFYRGEIELMQAGNNSYAFGGGLKDSIWYDAQSNEFIHQWVDNYGLTYDINLEVSVSSGIYASVIPELVLTNESTGEALTLTGRYRQEANNYYEHGYKMEGVPDGIYKLGAIMDASIMPYPVVPMELTVSIVNGKVINPGNTPPQMLSDYISYVNSGSLFTYSLYDEFVDLEQEKLYFKASSGWIIDGVFYYRDLIGADLEIDIKAYDGQGGTAGFVHTIKITDKMEAEEDYQPIPEIDSIGASGWAVPIIQNAIKASLIPVELLDHYQNSITREEFSRIIVNMIEKMRGEIKIDPSITFSDTDDVNILKAASLNILTGYNGRFSPYESLTREQMCAIIYRTVKAVNPYKASKVNIIQPYRDANQISVWAKDSVDFCFAKGIATGSNGILNPHGELSREQAIKVIYQAFVYLR